MFFCIYQCGTVLLLYPTHCCPWHTFLCSVIMNYNEPPADWREHIDLRVGWSKSLILFWVKSQTGTRCWNNKCVTSVWKWRFRLQALEIRGIVCRKSFNFYKKRQKSCDLFLICLKYFLFLQYLIICDMWKPNYTGRGRQSCSSTNEHEQCLEVLA